MVPFHQTPRTAGKAAVSLALGLFSIGCAGPVAGLPAIVLGALARREIDRSGGTLLGRGIAAGGIVSGLFGTGLGIVVLLWAMGAAFAPAPEPTSALSAAPAVTVSEPPAAPIAVAPPPASGSRAYGSLEVVDLDRSRPLRPQLAEVVARSKGRTVVLQTVVRSSPACAAVAAALPDHRMQRALANVTLVHVDIDEYESDLGNLKVETRSAPWFYKLDVRGEPTEALSADAWEANVPENMAPVLGKFVQHRPAGRRK